MSGVHPMIPDTATPPQVGRPHGPVDDLVALLDVRFRHATLLVNGCRHIENALMYGVLDDSEFAFVPQLGTNVQDHHG